MISEPHYGAICRCSAGMIGMITSRHTRPIIYDDGTRGFAWTGIQLQTGTRLLHGKEVEVRFGDPWCSRNPIVLIDAIGDTCTTGS